MKKFTAIFILAISCVLLSMSSFTAFAASEIADGIEVVFDSEKGEYSKSEKINVTLSVTNKNNFDVENIVLKNLIPEGYVLAENNNDNLAIEKLSANQTVNLSAEFVPATQLTTETTITTNNTTITSTTASTSITSESVVSSNTQTTNIKKNEASAPKTGDGGVVLYIVIFSVCAILIVISIFGKKKTKSTLALFICLGLVSSYGNLLVDIKSYAVETHETKSISVSKKVLIEGTELTLKAIVNYDLEIPEGDNLRDDIIDLGDIQTAVSNGKAEVIYNEYGDIVSINGTFTENQVQNANDAVVLLKSALPLFGENFSVDSSNITVQTTADSTDDKEYFYKYSPVVNGVPVLGSQIIISTDSNGNVTSLNSTYTDSINDVYTYANISAIDAEQIALNSLLSDERVDVFLNSYVSEEMNKEAVTDAFKQSLNISSASIIYNLQRNKPPEFLYQVMISTQLTNDNELPEGFGEDEEGIQGEVIFDDYEEMPEGNIDDDTDIGIVVKKIYYVYANGDNCGTIHSVIDGLQTAGTYNATAKDLKGNTRSFKVQGQNGKYWLRDAVRNLETYKTTYGGFLWRNPQLPGKIVTSNSFSNIKNMDKAAISLHANMSDVYDYYNNNLGRKSFDGMGAKIIGSYDYDDVNFIFSGDFENAYWSSTEQQFVFGDGANYTVAKDLVAHEFTHAVINYVVGNGTTTTLTYWGETGALNEAYADIMGSLIEGKGRNDAGRWEFGEDLGEVLRDMANPAAQGQPDNYSALTDPTWQNSLNNYQNRDNEGVHIFNSIYNLAYYKMLTDSRTSTVSDETWAKIFYRSLFRLTTNATFLDARGAVLCSAKNLGFDNEKQQAIKDAFDSVGITEHNSIRIVLKWGATPKDLDSHLVGPGMSGSSRFHIYYSQNTYFVNGAYDSSNTLYAADLDYDDTTSYGPEITTIHKLTPGTYYFYVHDYTNKYIPTSNEMAKSSATVSVYQGSSSSPIRRYTVNSNSSGVYWNVCKITIDSSQNVEVESVNTYDTVETYN